MGTLTKKKARKILESWSKEILINIIVDKMNCGELEQFVRENE